MLGGSKSLYLTRTSHRLSCLTYFRQWKKPTRKMTITTTRKSNVPAMIPEYLSPTLLPLPAVEARNK